MPLLSSSRISDPVRSSPPAPGRRAYVILGLLVLSTLMNNMDRQTVAVLKPTLKGVFHLDDGDYADLISAFTLCYATAYMFSGWVVDRLGARRALPLFMGVWSIASIGCGLAKNFTQLLFLRGLLGIAEPGNFPAALRAVTVWFQPSRRGFATGVYNLGTIFSPLIIAVIATHAGWQSAFILPGVLGLPILLTWWFCYHENAPATPLAPAPLDPRPAPAATAAPVAVVFPWKKLWRTQSLWGIILARFISDPVLYFLVFWMPGYLQENRGLTLANTGWVSWIPSLAANVGGLLVMLWSDRLISRGSKPLAARKKVLGLMATLGLCAPFIPHVHSLFVTMFLFSVVNTVAAAWLFGLVLAISEVYPAKNVGSVCGITGAAGALGAVIFNHIVGHAVNALGVNTIYGVLGLLHLLACLPLLLLVRVEIPRDAARRT